MTSPGWPQVMRVNPILKLDYAGVWGFLRGCLYEYCELYDQGYTSLGTKNATQKNPALVKKDSQLPAHELNENESDERSGRS